MRRIGDVILLACAYTAIGSGANAGKTLDATSSHVLVQADGAWRSAPFSDVEPDPNRLRWEPIALPDGETRGYLADGDEVIFRGHCAKEGFARIGFGECRAVITPAVV